MEYKKPGYKYLIVWRNASELRKRVYDITKVFPAREMRRVSQMSDAARSVKQNIQEGHPKSTAEFIRFLGFSQGSLAELSGDLEDCFEDGLISELEFSELNELVGKTGYLLERLVQSLEKKL